MRNCRKKKMTTYIKKMKWFTTKIHRNLNLVVVSYLFHRSYWWNLWTNWCWHQVSCSCANFRLLMGCLDLHPMTIQLLIGSPTHSFFGMTTSTIVVAHVVEVDRCSLWYHGFVFGICKLLSVVVIQFES